ncbi:hypothetical protein DFP72DRAFT_799787, partial [Ephemerocybe angulata]
MHELGDSDNDDEEASQFGEYRKRAEDQEDDVGVRVDGITGGLVLRSDQTADYLLRGKQLEAISLWDFVAQVDKIPNLSVPNSRGGEGTEGTDEEEIDCSDCGPSTGASTAIEELLLDTHRFRPRSEFQDTHLEARTHFLRIRLPTKRYIPVPIGPAIPRRDTTDPAVNERYSRLMLILFKPWRNVADLRTQGQSWIEAFDEFVKTCAPISKSRMDNMQVLHECKDSRDDH